MSVQEFQLWNRESCDFGWKTEVRDAGDRSSEEREMDDEEETEDAEDEGEEEEEGR